MVDLTVMKILSVVFLTLAPCNIFPRTKKSIFHVLYLKSFRSLIQS